MKKIIVTIIFTVLVFGITSFGQKTSNGGKSLNNSEILWDFREKRGDDVEKPQEFSKAETDLVMDYLFGADRAKDFEITTRVKGSFTKPNTKETLYYVGGCDDGEGFRAISNCSHASSWNAGWIAIYDGKTPIRKIEVALGYTVRFVTDVNGDGKEEILSLSGYSGMGETTVRGELGEITASGYKKIFPTGEDFYFGSYDRLTFDPENDEVEKCFALATVVSYVPTTDSKLPIFTEEYFKSSDCDSNWAKITKKQFDSDIESF